MMTRDRVRDSWAFPMKLGLPLLLMLVAACLLVAHPTVAGADPISVTPNVPFVPNDDDFDGVADEDIFDGLNNDPGSDVLFDEDPAGTVIFLPIHNGTTVQARATAEGGGGGGSGYLDVKYSIRVAGGLNLTVSGSDTFVTVLGDNPAGLYRAASALNGYWKAYENATFGTLTWTAQAVELGYTYTQTFTKAFGTAGSITIEDSDAVFPIPYGPGPITLRETFTYTLTNNGLNPFSLILGPNSGLVEYSMVPEPASCLLLGTGLVGLFGLARRRRR